jgi:CheY-like chemotaxis protein
MPQGGELTVSMDRVSLRDQEVRGLPGGEYALLAVQDTGVGMDPAILDRVLEPFFTTKPPGKGTGMGLAVVHGIVSQHGGALALSSEPGAGTEARAYLPLHHDPARENGERRAPPPRGAGRVLFVDDEERIAHSSKEMLEVLGYQATALTSPQEALRLLRRDPHAFDVLITDMSMPGLTGTDLAREALRLRPDLPVLLCTGFSEQVTPDEARAMGIRDYVLKPVDWTALAETMRRILEPED